MILKPCQSLHIKFWFFSGHFNIGQPRFVKKFDTIWAMDVGVPCLNLANCPWPHFGWIKAWTHPFTDLVSVKFQISWLIWLSICPNDQKKKNLTCKLLLRFRIIKTESDMHRHFSERGHFWKLFWSFWSQMKSNKWIFDFFWSFRHWTSRMKQEIWNLPQFEPGRWGSQAA